MPIARAIACMLLLALSIAPCAAGELKLPELFRGVKDGAFVDEYFGLRLAAEGLESSPGKPRDLLLFAGAASPDVEVGVRIAFEVKKPTAAALRDRLAEELKKATSKYRSIERGNEPAAWVAFEEESLSGAKHHVARGFYTRRHDVFTVQARATASPTSLATVKRLACALRVDPEQKAYIYAYVLASLKRMHPEHPEILVSAAAHYMEHHKEVPSIALELLMRVEAMGEKAGLLPDYVFRLWNSLGVTYAHLDRYEKGFGYYQRALAMVEETNDPDRNRAMIHFNYACDYSRQKKLDKAYENFKKALEIDEWGFAEVRELAATDYTLENFRNDPRYKQLLKEHPVK